MNKTFKSWASYLYFSNQVQHHQRYIYKKEIQEFLETVRLTSAKRIITIEKGKELFRAQKGCDERDYEEGFEYTPYNDDRMKPLKWKTFEGRANPVGIPYIYLATNEDTALAEMRAGLKDILTLAIFEVLEDLKIVNCVIETKRKFYLKQPSPEARENAVWSDINMAFKNPIDRNEDPVSYIPTQILAEVFKNQEYNGIQYSSSYGNGNNIVMFDIEL